MGPGYFPTILSYVIIAIGLVIALRGFTIDGPSVERIPLRPISLVVISILAFGFLIEVIGLALTAITLTFIASAARKEVKWRETAFLAVILALLCVFVFVYGLGQPMPAWWGR